jgi:RES domain-containing protein
LYGRCWNPEGIGVIYTAETISLAMLEVLVHFTELPTGYRVSAIAIPDTVVIETLPKRSLPKGWNRVSGSAAAREFGRMWIKEGRSAVLSVLSSIVTKERIFVPNPAHRDFPKIKFGKSRLHVFDARLK